MVSVHGKNGAKMVSGKYGVRAIMVSFHFSIGKNGVSSFFLPSAPPLARLGKNGVSSFFLPSAPPLARLGTMARLPRTIDDGLVYHALNRGNNRGEVFADDADRVAFLQALART